MRDLTSRFERWLRQGRGRAALAIDDYGDRPFRDALVWAIRHDLRYEIYSEDRVWFLHDLISRTRSPGFYRHIVLASLRAARSRHELWLLVRLANEFAFRGDDEAEQAVRAAIGLHLFRRLDAWSIRPWLERVGIDGFRWRLRLLEERNPPGREFEIDGLRYGAGQEDARPRFEFARLLPEAPADVNSLLTLARSSDRRNRRRVLEALAKADDQRIRGFALRQFRHSSRAGDAIKILTGHYQSGDWGRVERVMRHRMSPDERHDALLPIADLSVRHPHPDAIPVLISGYREGPCQICRRSLVRALIGLGAIPRWMREELPHDSDSETRALAQESDKMSVEPCSDSPGC